MRSSICCNVLLLPLRLDLDLRNKITLNVGNHTLLLVPKHKADLRGEVYPLCDCIGLAFVKGKMPTQPLSPLARRGRTQAEKAHGSR